MAILRTAIAFILGAAGTYLAAAAFYTQQILARQAEIGAVYTPAQMRTAYMENIAGLASGYGVVLAIALLIGFVVAFGVKRVVKPLAPVAYPVAGAAAVVVAIILIENVMAAGGAGAIGGARGAAGLALQGLAGAIGGLIFAVLRPK